MFCHSSDEHYGADRILLDIHDLLPDDIRKVAEFWVPTDLPHGMSPLCEALEARGAVVRHVDLPILRRAYMTPRGLARLAGRARRVRRQLKVLAPDVVYCTTSAAFLCAPLARSAGVNHVVGHVQEVWTPADARVIGRLARSCHQILTISEAVLEPLPGALQARATVVRNATAEPDSWTPLAAHEPPLRFLMAGRWNGWKGHRTLLDAWDRLSTPGELVVLGGLPASGESVDVRALAAGLRRPGGVHVVGEVEDPAPFVDATDVVLVPSDSPEPFGLVAIEAFARGRPVVASAAGGLREIVTHERDGWLFPPRDPAALARLLDSLTPSEVMVAGTAARRTYEERFTAARYAADWKAALPFVASPR